jgi:hypothetical protein
MRCWSPEPLSGGTRQPQQLAGLRGSQGVPAAAAAAARHDCVACRMLPAHLTALLICFKYWMRPKRVVYLMPTPLSGLCTKGSAVCSTSLVLCTVSQVRARARVRVGGATGSASAAAAAAACIHPWLVHRSHRVSHCACQRQAALRASN